MQADATMWGQVFLFLTTVVGFAFQAWREARQRRWDREDAARRLEALEAKVQERTEAVTQVVEQRAQEVAAKVDENTALSVRAFSEANRFNQKLTSMAGQFDAMRRRHERDARRADGDPS